MNKQYSDFIIIYNPEKATRKITLPDYEHWKELNFISLTIYYRNEISVFKEDLQLKLKINNGEDSYLSLNYSELQLEFRRIGFLAPALYFFQNKNSYIFSNSLRRIKDYLMPSCEIDYNNVSKYLVFGFFPYPGTAFKNLYKLGVNNSLKIRGNNFAIKAIQKKIRFKSRKNIDSDHLINSLLALFRKHLEINNSSFDENILLLSGGTDSSILANLLGGKSPISARVLDFKDSYKNETENALRVADKAGLCIESRNVIKFSVSNFTEFINLLDEPTGDSAAYSFYSVCGNKQQVCFITGIGADMISGNFAAGFFSSAKNSNSGNEAAVIGSKSQFKINKKYLKLLLPTIKNNPVADFIADMKKIYGKNAELLTTTVKYQFFVEACIQPINVIAKNINSYAYHPFLLNKAESIISPVPEHNEKDKALLKKIISKLDPDYEFQQRKHGFGIPLDSFFSGNRKTLNKIIFSGRIFKKEVLKKLLKDHWPVDKNHKHRFLQLIWNIIVLQEWVRSVEMEIKPEYFEDQSAKWLEKYNKGHITKTQFDSWQKFSESYRRAVKVNYTPPNMYLSVVDFCNLDCPVCQLKSFAAGSKKMIDVEFLKRIFDRYPGISSVVLNGGEPLLHKNPEEIFRLIKSRECNLKLYTNGILIYKQINALKLADKINISIDAYDAKSYRNMRNGNKKTFDTVCESLNLLDKEKIRFQLSFLLTLDNVKFINNYLEFAHNNNAGSVLFHNLNSYGYKCYASLDDRYINMQEIFSTYFLKNSFPFDITLPVILGPDKTDFYSTACTQLWNSVNIGPDGLIALCCHMNTDAKNGSILDNDFYNSKKLVDIRNRHIKGTIKNTICEFCPQRFYGGHFAFYNSITNKWKLQNK